MINWSGNDPVTFTDLCCSDRQSDLAKEETVGHYEDIKITDFTEIESNSQKE